MSSPVLYQIVVVLQEMDYVLLAIKKGNICNFTVDVGPIIKYTIVMEGWVRISTDLKAFEVYRILIPIDLDKRNPNMQVS